MVKVGGGDSVSCISLSTGGVSGKAISDELPKYFKPQSALKQKNPLTLQGEYLTWWRLGI